MTKEELIALFKEIGVLKTGHFRLTSGLHSSQYMQCATIFEYPDIAEKVVKELVGKLPKDIDTVIAPAIGGILMGYEVARAVGARCIFAERENGEMKLRRGFAVEPEEKLLVVEDVVTTGGSVKEVLQIVNGANANVLGVASIVDRSNGTVEFDVPFSSLVSVNIEAYQPEECPLCAAKEPIIKPGSRK